MWHNVWYLKWHTAQAGVPQGSVLALLLYLLYTTDLLSLSEVSHSVFADNTARLATSDNIDKATTKVRKHVNPVIEWASDYIELGSDSHPSKLFFSLDNSSSGPG